MRPYAPKESTEPASPKDLDEHFVTIIDRWRGPLVGILTAWSVAHPHELAEDAFAQLWLTRERYRGSWADSGAAGSWLRGIAWNLVREERRRSARAPKGFSESARETLGGDELSPEQELIHTERDDRIRAAIKSLPDDQRAVVYMRLMEGAPGRDVAALLGLSVRAVEGLLYRAKQTLARTLLVDEVKP